MGRPLRGRLLPETKAGLLEDRTGGAVETATAATSPSALLSLGIASEAKTAKSSGADRVSDI
ncbi:MAG: hypothetical protein AVDCRST_MAG62-1634 [uncultured Sphingomonas sp.]|uniref:Uncharacterized protein n=1 Tax=uncultured Sphingomonas sp. TaxID=158754 RepID=A0A6J4TNV7_9SPHN|nr:MAG: hypothetical protein AVDCRST_MAG62-1634 [uncultured Sphingomonas sp.]